MILAPIGMSCGREPAAHALVLQVGVEALGELLVLRRVADEAGVELDRLVQQRGQIVDQVVRQADAAQEDEGQGTGLLQCRWSMMLGPACLHWSNPLTSARLTSPNTVLEGCPAQNVSP